MSDKKITNVSRLSLADASKALASGDCSSAELVQSCLNKIQLNEDEINAFTNVNGCEALEEARISDSRRKSGSTLSELDGIPIAVKDNIDVMRQPTTNGLNMSWFPKKDADLIKNLR